MNEHQDVPEYLESTYSMLTRSFNQSEIEKYLNELIWCLYEYMSDRNLATILSITTSRDKGHIYNHIYSVIGDKKYDPLGLEKVITKLSEHGFDEWTQEE
ncbi:hypothetical protein GCM10008938_50480 [Deinococcus roseus]|uniref:Uncharacterized protein n=1 Tax=Deinococcus roseus TaxID=392414 RepID=A0ABQ2DHJ9_9DEIO|nr:hypothetical protein GCM10008938_50480 [Deinococcus roseus]